MRYQPILTVIDSKFQELRGEMVLVSISFGNIKLQTNDFEVGELLGPVHV